LSPEVHTVHSIPTPLEFHRYVSQNRPMIFKGCAGHWPAICKWTDAYLEHKLADKLIGISLTPDGYADAITWDPKKRKECFALPLEQKMRFGEFLELLLSEERQNSQGIPYIQSQNNNLNMEYCGLLKDIEPHLSFATEALDRLPDAMNFWMGGEKSITSLHKDHYENLYVVVSGVKEFILYAPTDAYFLYYRNYPMARYSKVHEEWELEEMNAEIPWISVNPLRPDRKRFPLYRYATPMKTNLYAGDILYLPSMHFHHVQQHGNRIVAVNYWYDMDYDIKYVYYQYLQKTIDAMERHKNRLG
jgi:peptidyl-lysine (3S)-dioxygenase / protease